MSDQVRRVAGNNPANPRQSKRSPRAAALGISRSEKAEAQALLDKIDRGLTKAEQRIGRVLARLDVE